MDEKLDTMRRKTHQLESKVDKRQRNRIIAKATACLKVLLDGDEVIITQPSKEGHNHDYTALDRRNGSAVRDLAMQEISKGYQAAEIFKPPEMEILRPCSCRWRTTQDQG
jgi:hypothetical protein